MLMPLDNRGRPQSIYVERLKEMTEGALLKEAEHKIWLSSYAQNNPRSDYHWQCRACYEECERRGRGDIYERAWKSAADQDGDAGPALPTHIRDGGSGELMPIQVLKSAAGFYLGAASKSGAFYSRESKEYWPDAKEAEKALLTGDWSPRRHERPPPAEFADGSISAAVYEGKAQGRTGR
jgi:hypothetical protein